MLSVIQDIPDFVLSSQLDIVIGADKQVTFSLNKGGSVILQETYTLDSKNQVHILDLFSLMEHTPAAHRVKLQSARHSLCCYRNT